LLFSSYSIVRRGNFRGAARFRRIYFDVDSTLSRSGPFSGPCFADGALFDSLEVSSDLPAAGELCSLQISTEPYPHLVVSNTSTFTMAAAVFSILGAAAGLIRPVTSAWHFTKGCVGKRPRVKLLLSLAVIILCIGAGGALQAYLVSNQLFQSEMLLAYVFLMSVGLAAFCVWIAHAVHFCQTSRQDGWSTQNAPLLSP